MASATLICQTCGLPKDICVCQELAKEKQKIKVYTEKRRYDKYYTIVEGFDSGVDVHSLTKELKRKLACGGTFKNNRIELQGNHKDRMKDILVKLNFSAEQIDIA